MKKFIFFFFLVLGILACGVSLSDGWVFVKSASSFDPTSISGLQLWVDSTDNATITQASSLVSQWNDKSGNGVNLTQSNGTFKPTVTANQINSKQVLAFPAITTFTANTGMAGSLSGTLSAFSYGILVQPLATTQVFTALLGSETSTGDITIETNGSDATKLDAYVSNTGASGATATSTFATGTTYFVFVTYNSPNLNIWVNNTQVLTNNTTNLTGRRMAQAFSVGGNTAAAGFKPLHGYVGDVVLYNSALGSTDKDSLYNSYIKPKWGTP